MEKEWRLIIDGKECSHRNMAKDEALLCSYATTKIPTLRIYGWLKPAVSLGYFQKADRVINQEACQQRGISFVRRITGGGAILHGAEVTYSIICSSDDLNLPRSVKESYQVLSSFILRFYRKLNLVPSHAYRLYPTAGSMRSNFCFSSCEHFDILIKGKKIGGNAQKRVRNRIFQHGSIPQSLNVSLAKEIITEVPDDIARRTTALDELLGLKSNFPTLQGELAESFSRTFGLTLKGSGYTDDEAFHAEYLAGTKYTRDEWNCKPSQASLVA